MQQLTDEQKKARLCECEAEMKEHYFHFRRFEERAVEIAVDRLYEASGYHTFLSYYKAQWMEGEKISARKYQLLKYAEVVGNIAEILYPGIKSGEEVNLPTSEKQTRPLSKYEPEEQAALWEHAQGETGKPQPSGPEVADVVAAVQPTRLDFVDTEPGPKWIDASPASHEGMPGVPDATAPRKERHTDDLKCDGHRLHYQLVVTRQAGQSPHKWYGFISRKQWEALGFSYNGKPQYAMDEENFTEDDGTQPDTILRPDAT